MDLDRRSLLTGIGFLGLTNFWSPEPGRLIGKTTDFPLANRCHPLSRSLLERASKIHDGCEPLDRATVERTMRQFADASGSSKSLVIKWMDMPKDAHDHLSGFGLDALLDMGPASFWRPAQACSSHDIAASERAFEVRMLANELLRVDEQDAILMAPKLSARSDAMLANLSDRDVFRVRAVSSQIGWLETSMADAAAAAVAQVELLLSTGSPEDSVAIDHQLQVFASHECGLLATWETPDAMLCVPMQI